jgi:hypothetical protein
MKMYLFPSLLAWLGGSHVGPQVVIAVLFVMAVMAVVMAVMVVVMAVMAAVKATTTALMGMTTAFVATTHIMKGHDSYCHTGRKDPEQDGSET